MSLLSFGTSVRLVTPLAIRPEVADGISAGRAVVALESTIVSHGLPRPDNLAVARCVEQVVRDNGAVPATIGVLDGVVQVGLDDDQLTTIACRDDIRKASVRDLATVVATRGSAATTVAATAVLAAGAGIDVFATGGLGGVHRGARDSWDESADLVALARTAICVVCSGVKSILDVPATLERLETLGISVLGYGTNAFPGFYRTDSGAPLDWRVDSPAAVAAVVRARRQLELPAAAVIVANPLPEDEQLDPELHDRVLHDALAAMEAAGVTGKAVTPFLLSAFHEETGGASLAANIRIIERNAELAARIAVAAARPPVSA
jgi:pseudouridylate synthase